MSATKIKPIETSTPAYWDEACKHLVKKDRVMKRLIPQFGDACLQSRGDAVHHAGALHRRPADFGQGGADGVGPVRHSCRVASRRPACCALKVDDMRAAGLSARKVEYLVDLALHFDSGAVHVESWEAMDDEAIIAELVAIRGIGRWTAEMFLIFHLMRPNVLPLDDVGLINGISRNYFSGEAVSRSDAREVARPGPRTALWRLGIFGARSTRCPSNIRRLRF